MRVRDDGTLTLSPTDLAYFLACRHRTALELSVAQGVRTRPVWDDPLLEALFAMGEQHERDYVDALRRSAARVVDLKDDADPASATARTLDAMRRGADVIVQAALTSGRWYGRPDVLRKVDRPSPGLGAWSYEPEDTKLARETRGGTILQLGLYCELLEDAQGVAPEKFRVVAPGDTGHIVRSYRFHDYSAYFRLVKARFEEEVARGHEDLEAAYYPEPVEHCDICPWSPRCEKRRRDDDHLSLVARISRLQRRELEPRGVTTVEAVADLGDPIPFKPGRGALETYERIRDQARLQVRSRHEERIAHELIEPVVSEEPAGLARLPSPSPGDLFLDLEGDPLAPDGGREYLFGLVSVEPDGVRYQRWWADDAAGERRAFEEVVEVIVARLQAHPDMHVYHYAPYEPSALKRLMGRYATREREIDELLRGRRLIDLYAVVRQGVRVGVERYSIKNLEPLYDFTRDVSLKDANRALRVMEQAIEFGRLDLATPEVRRVIEGYNRDDCVSTLRLRDWLEARRDELIARGGVVDRPPLVPGEASEELDEKAQAVEALRRRLLDTLGGVPDDPAARTPDQHARYLVAYLLDWHRREDKADWWEYYRLRELPEEDLFEERRAVAGLRYVQDVEQRKKSVVQRYSFPEQELDLRPNDTLKTQDGKTFPSEIVAIDYDGQFLDLLVGPSKRHQRPTALFAHKYFPKDDIEQSLFDLGRQVADANGVASLRPSPERALLLREPPRLALGPFEAPGAGVTEYAVSIVTRLNRTALAVQGPPGSGKTYTGAHMILAAVAAGMKVGVTANSHKVIRNLLAAVAGERARLTSPPDVRLGHKCGADEVDEVSGDAGVEIFRDNDAACAALADGSVNVLGGTAWLWSRPESVKSVDLLFVDEAGQMSLANVVGIARAAKSVVLLGDPRQLDQPTKGSHPVGVDVSALEHILGGAQTMTPDRGLFLPITWRLPPAICGFTSELFYENKLESKPGLERQALRGNGEFEGAGFWLRPIDHAGNRSASDEEAAEVARIVSLLLAPGSLWIDERGTGRQMTPSDIRIVAPFNAHVHRIKKQLALVGRSGFGSAEDGWTADEIPVGTVDKFQGQQAPVVVYSMATSRPEDAPRGMEFLYSLNRLNVATSRAQCACIVVCNPRLFEPECRTPRQMALANGVARVREKVAP